jgi:predicted AAA+ superfamily ATPase
MRDFSLKQAIVEGTLSGNTKGGLYESFIADALFKSGHTMHFLRDETTKCKIDFLVQRQGRVIPVEVKAGRATSTSLKSLVRSDASIDVAYKVDDTNVSVSEDGVVTIPHYMAMCI